MRVTTEVMDGFSPRPLIRHLLRKCHLPPCGGKAGAGGHMGPPLRILTGEAYGRKHLIRHRLSAVPPCPTPFVPSGHFPLTGGIGLKGKAGRAHAVRPYANGPLTDNF